MKGIPLPWTQRCDCLQSCQAPGSWCTRKPCRVGWGCTPFHHCPLHPLILTAEHLRNPFLLSPKHCRGKAAPEGPCCQTSLPSSVGRIKACPGSSFSRSDDGFVLIQSFPHDERNKPLSLAKPGGVTYCLYPGRREQPEEHVALQVCHTPFPQKDTWTSPHTPDGALWDHFTTEWVVSGYCCFLHSLPFGNVLGNKGVVDCAKWTLALTYYGIWSQFLGFPEPSFIQLQDGSNNDAKITSYFKD